MPRVTTSQKRNAALPAYHRLYVLIAEAIKDGVYAPGALLPSEKTLTETYEVSRVTVRRALDQLVEDGLVSKHQGQGSIVKLRDGASSNTGRVSGLLSNVVKQGAQFTSKTLFWNVVTPSAQVCDKLNLSLGSKCLLIRRARFIKKAPISYASIYLPEDVGKSLKRARASNQLVLELLENTDRPPEHMEFTMSATLADGEGANVLELPVGSPLLRMRGVAYDKNSNAIYFQDSLYHPDRYEYEAKLVRDKSSGKMVWRNNS